MEDKPRYSRISDILELIVLMQSKTLGITLTDIQNEFNVSRRTAERLRDSITNILPQVGEIDFVGKEKHWGFISGNMREIVYFSPDEIAMLETIKEGLEFEDRQKALNVVINKLKALFNKQISKIEDRIELLLRTEGVAVTQRPNYKIDVEKLDIIRQAIKENKKIKALYNGKEKLLAPYGIIYGTNIYLIGVEGKFTVPYVYTMHKLSDVVLTREEFDKGDFDIKEYANKSFGVYQNEPYKVELLFKEEVAEDVLNYNFHPTQKIKQNEDGTVTVKFKASGDLEILWHIFRWGKNVKILSPKILQAKYIQMLEDALKNQIGEDKESKTRKMEVKTKYIDKMTVEDWDKLVTDDTIFNRDSLIVLKRMMHGGNKPTDSSILSTTYGGGVLYYGFKMDDLEERLLPYVDAYDLPLHERWTIIFKGYSDYTYKIRPELYEALKKLDLSDLPLYEEKK